MARVQWNDPKTGERGQFVADVLRESLFDYAFDSNKVPSLNLHYFCKDYMTTYGLVKADVMKVGNMIPLNEEFDYIINNSPWLPQSISPSMFSFRGKSGEYQDIRNDKNIDEQKKSDYFNNCANYADKYLGGQGGYYQQLLSKIESLLTGSNFDTLEQEILYYCIRELICELINLGVNKAHIYSLTQKKLHSSVKPANDIEYVLNFLKELYPASNEYSVVFGITETTYKELTGTIKDIREANEREQEALSSKYVVEITLRDLDPVSALENAKYSFSTLLCIYNCFIHSRDISDIENGLVKCPGDDNYRKINSTANIMKRNPNKAKKERLRQLKRIWASRIPDNLISSFELHNIAVNSENIETQLLMLWTIFELLIETRQDMMSKVNYITNAVSAVLCNGYYKHILQTLESQITVTTSVSHIIKKEPRGATNVEKLAYILKDNIALQNEIIGELTHYPLEVYKIKKYSAILSSSAAIKNDLRRHSFRVRWQLMRIYRNRCMIVHDGSHMPYADNILENLHFYVDTLLEYMVANIENGINNSEAILSSARIKEKTVFDLLGDKNKKLSDEEYLKVMFP